MKKCMVFISIVSFISFMNAGCQTNTEKKDTRTDTTQVANDIPQKITFPSLDKLPVSANLYLKSKDSAFIVLCHMAGFNKSEYKDIAKTLMDEGFNCLAIDQRSGGSTSGYENETFNEAVKRGLPASYLDAEQDIIAAVEYVFTQYNKPVILWGSSYSASLALKIGKANDHVKAILAFSPGEYFQRDSMVLKDHIRDINKPVFVTSSRDEVNDALIAIIDAVGPKTVTHFRPKGRGEHGAQVLWKDSPDNPEYWKAVNEFLEKF